MTKVTITYGQLSRRGACEDQLELFKKTFPKGISVTSEEELVAIAKKFGKDFDIAWAARNLLSEWDLLGKHYYPKWGGAAQLMTLDLIAGKLSLCKYEEYIATALAKLYYQQETQELELKSHD